MSKITSPFSLARQALAHGKFEDKETRTNLVGLLDEMERELDNSSYEFQDYSTISAMEALQNHLIELLDIEEEEENKSVDRVSRDVVSVGEILDDEDS